MKRKLSLLLAMVLAMTMIMGMSLTAFASGSPNRWDEVSYDTGIVALVDDADSEEIFYIYYGYGPSVDVTSKYYFGDTLVLEYSQPFGDLESGDGVGINNTIASAIDIFYYVESLFPGKTEDDIDWKISVTWDGTNKILSTYFYFKNTNPDSEPEESSNSAHTHEWIEGEIYAASQNSDGLEGIYCKTCGAIKESHPISAYTYSLNSYAVPMINAAKSCQTITFEFGEWNSFPKSFMEKLVNKSANGVTFVFHYKWNHQKQEITIPAGTSIDLNFDWYDPAKMAELYGMN